MILFFVRQAILLAASAAVAVSCNDSGGTTFDDFRFAVRSEAGRNATDCGIVAIGGDRSEANCCILSHYSQALPAFAVYRFQGTDSFVASAVAVDGQRSVTNFGFDSDPNGGGRSDNGRITSRACRNPQPAANACSDPDGLPFECSS